MYKHTQHIFINRYMCIKNKLDIFIVISKVKNILLEKKNA